MKTVSVVRTGLGGGAALLLAGFLSAAPAQAAAGGSVPCSPGALVAANAAGGGTVNLAPGCTYQLASADNGENGLPVVTTRIGVNGNGATIAGNNSDFRVFEVDGPGGNLSLQNVTITGGSADIGGGIENAGGIFTNGGTVTLSATPVTGNTPDNCEPPGTIAGCTG
jgi:hypothetical protein